MRPRRSAESTGSKRPKPQLRLRSRRGKLPESMGDTQDEDYRPRADDHLVEPFLAGLAPERPSAAPRTGRRGCGGAALLVIVLAGGVWLLA